MMRFSQQIGQTVAAIALTSLLVFSLAEKSQATIVGAKSTGDELDGGLILVTFAQQGVQAAQIVAGGPGLGVASLPNLFSFSVKGDTFLADWTLRNDTTFDDILVVEFDLTGTVSPGDAANPGPHSPGVLFDDGTSPSTPNGFAGRKGAVQVNVGVPIILNSFEVNLWPDAMNTGDEYIGEFIEYEGFGPLMTSIWRDDTDIVGTDTGPESPEPASAILLLIASAGFLCQSRRHRHAKKNL